MPDHRHCPALLRDRVELALVAIERHRVVALVLDPEGGLEAGGQRLRLRIEPGRQVGLAAHPGQLRHPPLGVEDVALDLGQGDRRLGLRPVRSRIASLESFQPWFSRPRSERRSYSTNPSPSRSPCLSIHSSAARAFGHSRSTSSRSPVQSNVAPSRISHSGVESTEP